MLKTTILVAVLIILALVPACYGDKGIVDVVLVIDSSGSMKKTDPMSLRIPAAKLFISLLDENDRAGVVSFSGRGSPIMNLTHADSETNRGILLESTEKITSNGLYTNLFDALKTGFNVLSADKREKVSRIIVLMSDGMMDTGDPEEDMKLLDQLKKGLTDTLVNDEVKVYSIAFTKHSDQQLLKMISKQTGGFYNLALTDQEFHLIFTSIFESLKAPEMLPMRENGFLIDKSVSEVTIVVTKEAPDTKIQLNSPDGEGLTNAEKRPDVQWFASNKFDMITVKKPVEGRWKILFSTGKDNKAYVITDLKLHSNFDQLYATFGDPLDIKIWLEKDGRVIKEQDILDKIEIYIELTGPDGKTSKLNPFSKGDGTFLRKIAPFNPGDYEFRIVAKGKTFERTKSFVFNVADARESMEDVTAKRENKKASEETDEEPVEQKITEENKTDEISWTKVIMQFIAINIALGIMILSYMNRNRIKMLVASYRFKALMRNKGQKVREDEDRHTETETGKKEDNQEIAGGKHQAQETSSEQETTEEYKNEIALEEAEHSPHEPDNDSITKGKNDDTTPEEKECSFEETEQKEQDNISSQEIPEVQEKETERHDEDVSDVPLKQEDTGDEMRQEASQQEEAEQENNEKTGDMMQSRAERRINLKAMEKSHKTAPESPTPQTHDENNNNTDDMWQEALQQQEEAKPDEKAIQVQVDTAENIEAGNSKEGKEDKQQIVDIDEVNKLLEAEKHSQNNEEGAESDSN